MNYLSEIDDWKKFEKKNPIVALDTVYVKMNIYPTCILKCNSNHGK